MSLDMRRDKFMVLLYSAADAQVGQRLLEHYRSNGLNVWIDEDPHAGTVWTGGLSDAIEYCDCVVLLTGGNILPDDYFDCCYRFAHQLEKPLLLVSLCEKGKLNWGCRPPEAEIWVLPDDPKFENIACAFL